ncbi:MAG: hypothetical protein OXU25_01090, partial [Thaumarchaeota archaeon]|nr:hypothetical protein [Nitrososphaerota archaeon]
MGRLVRIAARLEKRGARAETALRGARRGLQKEHDALRRSSPGLRAIERRVRGARETLADATGSLARGIERRDRINALIEAAGERLARERAALEAARREAGGAASKGRRRLAMRRADSIGAKIARLEAEIRDRKRAARAAVAEVSRLASQRPGLAARARKARPAAARRPAGG